MFSTRAATLGLEAPVGMVADGWSPRVQPRVAGAGLALLVGGASWLAVRYGLRHGALFLVGGGCGVVLYHAAFGFARGFRAFVAARDGRGLRAQMLMLAVATLLVAPLLASGEVMGRTVSGAVAPLSVSVLVGAFVFGIGMQLGGGCGSGTLFQFGGGIMPLGLTLLGFVAGSVLATFHMPLWWSVPSVGQVSLSAILGWIPAVLVQLVVCGAIATLTWWGERRAGVADSPREAATRGWGRAVQGPWPLAAGAVGLAGLNALTVILAGHPWTITWAFTLWGGKALRALGYDLSAIPFWRGEFQQQALAAPVLADVTSVMNVGIVLGALLAAGLAGRFAPARRIPMRIVTASVLGGLLLGYGARIAFGCNIGAYFSGIASTSLHGWLWGAAALLGTPLGLALRRLFGLDRLPGSARSC